MTRPTVPPDWATDVNYTAGARPWNSQPTKTQPSSGRIASGFQPEAPQFADETNWLLNNHGLWLSHFDNVTGAGFFGNGSDGSVDLDGVNTVPWATYSAGVYSMTRDACVIDCIVRAAITIDLRGYRLLGRGMLTTEPTATVIRKGTDGASGASGGGSAATEHSGTLVAGGKGGTGGGGFGSTAGNGVSVTAFGGSGGAGGVGSGAAGTAGTATAPGNDLGNPNVMPSHLGYVLGQSALAAVLTPIGGGAGGGGGGSNSGNAGHGGTGGNGGGNAVVAFRNLNLASAADIFCGGGVGGAGDPTLHTGGGGGGGGGTLVLIYYRTATGLVFSDVVNCPGGAGGASGGAPGGAGANGATGKLYQFNLGA